MKAASNSKILKDLLAQFEVKLLNIQDDIMTKMDQAIGEMKTVREEQSILGHRQSNHSDRIENLEIKVFGKAAE